MSQVLTVPTHFQDIGELSEGFLDRVENDTLILYGPVPYEDGSEIDFAVLLADGTSALEGKGRVRAAVDGGAERVPETRYDVVVEALELEGRFQVVFESLLMVRQSVSEPPPALSEAPELEVSSDEVFSVPPGEVMSVPPEEMATEDNDEPVVSTVPPATASEDEYEDAELEMSVESDIPEEALEEEVLSGELSMDAQATLEQFAGSPESQAPVEETDEDAVAEAGDADPTFEEAFVAEVDEDGQPLVAAEPNVGGPVPKPSMAAPPAAPPAPAALNLVPPPEGLTRPSRATADEELLASYEEAGGEENSGLFEYEEGLPIPSRPPLPDLNAPRRVATVEANDVDDVEESEPPEAHDDYEEIRLSEMAESAEEG
ncbi:MAG: hypothetical protein WBG86_18955 [Polyangiales bacterium]